MHVFLITVFVLNGGTVNFVQPMPSIESCKAAMRIHNEIPKDATWNEYGIFKPILVKCESK